jgi:hypothetical protein
MPVHVENELSRACRATWFSTLENGKPDSGMANNITAIIEHCWYARAM